MKTEEKEIIAAAKSSSDTGSVEPTKKVYRLKWMDIASYLRELSIVIIGILITLSITTAINNYSRQKELTGMLSLVTDELIENQRALEWTKMRWQGEQQLYTMLRENITDVLRIPTDTFRHYAYTVGTIYDFQAKDESFDVLKNSVLKQYIQEKELIYELSAIYRYFNQLNTQLTIYTNQKKEDAIPIMFELNEEELQRIIDENDAGVYYDTAIKNKRFRKFIITSGTILNKGIFEETLHNLTELIRKMEEYGY